MKCIAFSIASSLELHGLLERCMAQCREIKNMILERTKPGDLFKLKIVPPEASRSMNQV